MQILGGLVTVLNLLLAAVVAVRLFRLSRRSANGVERLLAMYFLCHAFIGSGLSCGLYLGWADPELALPRQVEIPLHVVFQVFASVGAACAYLFTWRTFRPDSERAKGFVAIALAVLAGSLVGIGATDGFAIQILNGPVYWVHCATKIAFLPWVAIESFHYWGLQRKRLALGLADPLVANRFWLWGWWAASMFLMGLSEPIARFLYVMESGSTVEWIPEKGLWILNATIAYSSAVGLVSVTMLFLAFFPPAGYRRWVEGRAGTSRAPAPIEGA